MCIRDSYYAARSAASEQGRFLFGWVPTRVGESAMGTWHWGGTLVVLEVYQRPDGTLGTKTPDTVRRFFGEPQSTPVSYTHLSGSDRGFCAL